MTTDRETSVSIGKLTASVEALLSATTTIQGQLTAASSAQSRIETQLESAEGKIEEMKKLLHGADGTGGITKQITRLDTSMAAMEKDVHTFKIFVEDSKKTVIKIVLLVLGSGALSGGLASKILAVLSQ